MVRSWLRSWRPRLRRSKTSAPRRSATRRWLTRWNRRSKCCVRAGRGDEADIVETGVLMAMDPELAARVETLTLETGREAADALREAAEEMALELSLLPDPTLALRADDVRSVGRRAAAHLQGAARRISEGVLIAVSLGPADVAELAPTVRGIALSGGGVTAHAASVARSLGLPMG